MRVSIDPKPIGAFIEYTLKPLIDDSRELLDLMDKHDIKLGSMINHVFLIYVFDCVIRSLVSLVVTGMICYTAWHCLHIAN